MTDYNKYVLSINKIFEVLGKIKQGVTDKDNLAHIESIDEYRQVIIKAANNFSNEKNTNTSYTEQDNMQKINNSEADL